jgi:hypothetical protein
MAAATVKGRAIGAGTGDPTDLSQAQLSDLFRVWSGFDETGAPGTYHNYAVAEGTKLLRINPNASGDFIITGIALGAANSGGWIRLFKQGTSATERIVLKHADAGSLSGNQLILPDGLDFILERSGDSVDLQYIGGRWQVVATLIGTSKLVDDAVTNAKAADMADSTIKGRALGAGTGDPQDLTRVQVGDITRLSHASTGFISGTFNDYAVTDGVHVLDCAASGGDVIFTGFSCGASNVGAWFWLTKFGGSNRIIIKHQDAGSLAANRVNTPNATDYILSEASRGVLIAWNNTRLQVIASPLDHIAQGTMLGRTALGGTGLPEALNGLQQGQNLRRGSWYVDSTTTGSVATYTIPEDATQIVFTGSGTITLQGATIITGKVIDWSVDLSATVEVTFVNDGVPTVTQERFRCPNGQSITIRAGEGLSTVHYFNRHRVISVPRAGFALTDGDKGDITVASSGAAWTVDNSVVTNAKLFNMDARRIKGRANGAGTGSPEDLTGVQLGAILRLGNFIGDGATTGTVATYVITEATNMVTFNGVTNVIHGFTTPAEAGQLLIVQHIGAGTTTLVQGSTTTGTPTNRMRISDAFGANTLALVLGGGHDLTAIFIHDGTVWIRVNGSLPILSVATSHLANDAVTNAKLANMAAVGTVKGVQIDAVANDPVDLTGAEVGELLRIGTVQTVSGALPLAITLNADTTFLSITTAGDGEIRTITGSTLGRVVLVMLFASGTKTIKHNFSAGTSSALICPGLVDFAAQVRDSFFLVGAGTDGWQVVSAPLGLARVGTAQLVNDAVDNTKLANMAAVGTVKGVQIDAVANDPVDLTGAEVGELSRYEYVQNFTLAPGVQTLTLDARTTKAFVTPNASGDVIFNQIIHGSSNLGASFTLVKEGTVGRVVLRDSNTSVNSIWTSGSIDYALPRYNDSVELSHTANATGGGGSQRWRPHAQLGFGRLRVNGGSDFYRGRVNLIPGPGVTITPADDSANDEVDVTISATALQGPMGPPGEQGDAGEVGPPGPPGPVATLANQANISSPTTGGGSNPTVTCGGPISLPANSLRVGDCWHFVAHWRFTHTAAATPLLDARLEVSGTPQTFQVTPVSVAGTYHGTWDVIAVCRAVGASGELMMTFRTCNSVGVNDANKAGGAQFLASIDTTVARTLELTTRTATAVVGNLLTVDTAFVHRIV